MTSHRLGVLVVALAIAISLTSTVPATAQGNAEYETLPVEAAGVDGPAFVSELVGDELWIGGSFSSARDYTFGLPDHATTNLAVIDINTGELRTDRQFDLPAAGSIPIDFSHGDSVEGGGVFALETDGVSMFVGGWFESADGAPRHNLAAYDLQTGDLVDTFAPVTDARILDLLYVEGWLYVAGYFDTWNGASSPSVIRVDPASGDRDMSFDVTVADGRDVWALDHRGGSLYLAGALGVRAVDAATGAVQETFLSSGIAADVAVSLDGTRIAVAHEDNNVYVFDSASGAQIWRTGASGPMLSVAWSADVVYVGTTYQWSSSQDRFKLVALDAETGERDSTDFIPELNSFWAGRSVLLTPQGLVVTGDFSKIAIGDYDNQPGTNARRVAIFRPSAPWPLATPLVEPGDVNCDGVIDSADVQAVLDDLSGLSPIDGPCAPAGDVDSDGRTGLLDALAIAQISA